MDASAVASAQQSLANVIAVTDKVYNTAEDVILNIEHLMEEDPLMGVLGFVSSMAKYFVENKEYKEILR